MCRSFVLWADSYFLIFYFFYFRHLSPAHIQTSKQASRQQNGQPAHCPSTWDVWQWTSHGKCWLWLQPPEGSAATVHVIFTHSMPFPDTYKCDKAATGSTDTPVWPVAHSVFRAGVTLQQTPRVTWLTEHVLSLPLRFFLHNTVYRMTNRNISSQQQSWGWKHPAGRSVWWPGYNRCVKHL